MYATLYARALNGRIKVWTIMGYNNSIITTHGYFTGEKAVHNLRAGLSTLDKDILSKIAKKKSEGYKDINDIYALTGEKEPAIITEEWLAKVLPASNLDANYNLKPMKCQPFKRGRMKYPAIAQPKYNGVRAVLRLENSPNTDLFSNKGKRAVVRSKSGLEYHMPHITSILQQDFFIDKNTGLEIAYDGELYIHNTPLNVINSACPLINEKGVIAKSSNWQLTNKIGFVVFDIATEDLIQSERISMIKNNIKSTFPVYPSEYVTVNSDNEVLEYTAHCIAKGYEGCVVRDIEPTYAFGSRPMTIMKVKQTQDAEFKIIDIIPKPKEPETALFVLQNDINDAIFECNPMGDYNQRRYYLINREELIGKMATVKFHERSGVKQVPFHANVVTIRDYE